MEFSFSGAISESGPALKKRDKNADGELLECSNIDIENMKTGISCLIGLYSPLLGWGGNVFFFMQILSALVSTMTPA